MFLGEAIGPFDHIRQFAPWNGPKSGHWDVLQADGVLQFYVWRDMVFESWGKGQVPFWNPYELAGYPLLANSQSGALYPPHILMGVLHVPTALAVTLLAWFHLFWAGLGTSKLVRALGGTQVGGVVAGASFALSPFMLSWTALSSVITTVCWIPWMLWAVASLFNLPEKLKVGIAEGNIVPVRAHQWRSMWLLAIFFAMMILGGHLQFVAYGAFAVFLTAATLFAMRLLEIKKLDLSKDSEAESFVSWQEKSGFGEVPGAVIARVVVAIALGLFIASPQILPVLQYSKFSHRQNVPSDTGYRDYSLSALQPFEAVGLINPKLVGDPRADIPNIETAGGISSYWPQYFKRGANFAEGALSIGPVVFLLLFSLRRQSAKKALPIGIVGILGLLLAFGTFVNRILYFYVPGWSGSGSPGRAIVLFVFAACVVAGLALPDQPEPQEEKKRTTFIPIVALVVAGILALWYAKVGTAGMVGFVPGIESPLIGQAISDLVLPAFLVLTVTAIFGYLWISGKVVKPIAWVGVAIVIAAFQTGGLVTSGKPLEKLFSGAAAGPIPVPAMERLAFINLPWDLFNAAPALMPPNLAALNRLHELGGYDSLVHRDSLAVLKEVNGQDPAPPANGNMMFIKPTADPNLLKEAGVTEVWSIRPFESFGQPFSDTGGIFRYRLDGPGRASIDGKSVPITAESYSSVTVDAEGPGKLTLRDRNMPGWSVTVDGKEATLQGTTWMEVELEAGKHKVEFQYVPQGYKSGLPMAIGAWLIVLVGMGLSLKKNQAQKSPSEII